MPASSHHGELCRLGKEWPRGMAGDRHVPVEMRNTKAGPELDTGSAGPRCSANDKVLCFSSTF